MVGWFGLKLPGGGGGPDQPRQRNAGYPAACYLPRARILSLANCQPPNHSRGSEQLKARAVPPYAGTIGGVEREGRSHIFMKYMYT